jgi:hypothetical protein
MHEETLAVLRHVSVNGPRTRDEVKKAFPGSASAMSALANLTQLGYLTTDDSMKPIAYTLTGKGRTKLVIGPGPLRTRRDPAKLQAEIPSIPRVRRMAITAYQPQELDRERAPGLDGRLRLPEPHGQHAALARRPRDRPGGQPDHQPLTRSRHDQEARESRARRGRRHRRRPARRVAVPEVRAGCEGPR